MFSVGILAGSRCPNLLEVHYTWQGRAHFTVNFIGVGNVSINVAGACNGALSAIVTILPGKSFFSGLDCCSYNCWCSQAGSKCVSAIRNYI